MNYSIKGVSFINFLGFKDLMDHGVEPYVLYKTMALESFKKDLKGESADSLRRCLSAFEAGMPNRGTEEFDNLIFFREPVVNT